MANPESHNPIDDERLSAYLDGELSDPERAEVEARIASDAVADRLVSELRQLSNTLQRLPREKADPALRQQVLARIAAHDANGGDVAVARPETSKNPRGWFWAVAAIAAALMLTLYLPETEEDELPAIAGAEHFRREIPASESSDFSVENEVLGRGVAQERRDVAARQRRSELKIIKPMEEVAAAPGSRLEKEESDAVSFLADSPQAPKGEGLQVDDFADAADAAVLGLESNESLAEGQVFVCPTTVDITCERPQSGLASFQQLLHANNVQFRGEPQEQSQLVEPFFASRGARQEPEIAEAVVVEANQQQIDQILSAVHRDDSTYKQVVVYPTPTTIGSVFSGRGGGGGGELASDESRWGMSRWQQYQRPGPQPPTVVPSTVDTLEAGADAQTSRAKVSQEKGEKNRESLPGADDDRVPQQLYGWAVQLDLRKQRGQRQLGRNVEPLAGYGALARENSPESTPAVTSRAAAAGEPTTDLEAAQEDPNRVQVLFLLRNADLVREATE